MLTPLRLWRLAVLGLAFPIVTRAAVAAPPQLTSVIPRGWKAGANEVVIQGANLAPTARLVFTLPGATATLKPEPAPTVNQLTFTVTLPESAAPGVTPVWLAQEDGLSPPLMVVVDAFPNLAEVEPNNAVDQAQAVTLPAGIEGRLGGPESDIFQFTGNAGDVVTAEIAGRRIGANIKPVLRLLSAERRELAAARPSPRHGGDARVQLTLPAQGTYLVEVQDLLYRGDNLQYRLLIGSFASAQGIFPLGGRPGPGTRVEFLGLPTALLRSVEAAGTAPPWIGVTLPAGGAVSPFGFPFQVTAGGMEDVPEPAAVEGQPAALRLNTIINGRIAQPEERDLFLLPAIAGGKLRLAVWAERLGSPLDSVLEIRNAQGGVLATQDDAPGTADSILNYVVPADAGPLTLSLTDVHGRGGPEFGYRLAVAAGDVGDFTLSVVTPLANVPAGGSASFRVKAAREDFNGPIRLRLAGDVPPGLQLTGAEIGLGTSDTFLSLTAPADAPLRAGLFQIIGEAGPAEAPTHVRLAEGSGTPALDAQPWLREYVGHSIAKPASPTTLAVEIPQPMLRSLEYTAKVTVRRAPEQTGPINLKIETSHVPLPGQGNVAPQPNQVIPEGMNEAVIKIVVPENVPDVPQTLLVTGQLLDAKDKRTVVATIEAPSAQTRVLYPFTLALTMPAEWKRGTRHVIAGKLTRHGPTVVEPIQISLQSLPGNLRTEPLTLAGDATDFQIPIVIPVNQPPGVIPNVKILSVWTATPPRNATPIDVPIVVSPTEPAPLLEAFDEGNDFVAALTEGNGTATLETADVYRGKECLAVTTDQKGRAVLPGFATVVIAENPQPGQYRYLRFAWKKKEGTGVLLQLAHNNQFGAASTKQTDFRYVAGADKLNTKAIRVADGIPAEWTVVTRDLFADHGPGNLTGLSLVPFEGGAALLDAVYFARTEADFPALK